MTRKTATISFRKLAILNGLVAVLSAPLAASVLDWSIYRSDYTITPGPYTDPAARNSGTIWNSGNTQVLQKTLVNVNSAGVDIRVTITGNTSNFATSSNNALGIAAPQVSHLSWDPLGSGLRDSETFTPKNPLALVLDLDHTDWTQSVTVTFDYFKTGTSTPVTVQNVSYEIYDIDIQTTDGGASVGYVDEVRNFTSTFNGSNGSTPTLSSGGLSGGTTGNGGGTVYNNTSSLYGIAGNTENTKGGHGTVTYGANALMQSHSLTYGNYNVFDGSFTYTDTNSPLYGSVASNQPVQQFIGIGNINFTATPEAGTVIGYAAALGVAGLGFRRRRK